MENIVKLTVCCCVVDPGIVSLTEKKKGNSESGKTNTTKNIYGKIITSFCGSCRRQCHYEFITISLKKRYFVQNRRK